MKEEIKKCLDSTNFKFKDIDENGVETELTLSGVIEKLINDNKLLAKENQRYDDALRMANKNIDLLMKRIDKALDYINNWLDGKNNEDIIIAMNKLGIILKGKDKGEDKE